MQATLPDFDSLWRYDAPAESEAAFRDLLPGAEAAGDNDYLAQLLTQIARAQGLQRDFDGAHLTLDRVEAMLPSGPSVARVRYLLERGRAFRSAGDAERARALFVDAWETARSAGSDPFAVDAAHMVAIAAGADEAAALDWNERALALAESSSNPAARRWRASLLNNLGWTHHDAGRYEQALEHFERALAAREEAGIVGPIRIARWAIARTLRSLGRLDGALAIQRALSEEHAAAGTSDGYVSEELGEILLAQGQADEAQGHFARAATLLGEDPWFAEAEAERLARLRRLAGQDDEAP